MANVIAVLHSLAVVMVYLLQINQRTSQYTLHTAAQKENVNMSEALIWNADRETHTQPLYTHTHTHTHTHTVNQRWCLNRRQLQVSASLKWQLPWWQWQGTFKHFNVAVKEKNKRREMEREHKNAGKQTWDWATGVNVTHSIHVAAAVHRVITLLNPKLKHVLTADILFTNSVTLHWLHFSPFVRVQISGHSASGLLIPLRVIRRLTCKSLKFW